MGNDRPSGDRMAEWNPLADELASGKKELGKLRRRRTRLASAIEEHDRVDIAPVRERRVELEESAREHMAHSRVLEGRIKSVDDDVTAAEHQVASSKLFSRERRKARRHLADTRSARNKMMRQLKRSEKTRASAAKELAQVEERVAEYESFDRDAKVRQRDELAVAIDHECSRLDQLHARKTRLDQKLTPLVNELVWLRETCAAARAELGALAREIDDQKARLAIAQEFKRNLGQAGSGYERRLIHEKSESLLGDGQPGKVIYQATSRISDCEHQQRKLHPRIEGIERSIGKMEDRIAAEATKGSRCVEQLVLDGNNLCYRSGTFIGTRALEALSAELIHRWTVTIVFDADIRSLLKRESRAVQTRFPGAEVHVVATGEKADETILRLADNASTYVISNDRYTDFPDYPAAHNRRVIRHEILSGRALINDLDIDVKW